MALDDPAFHDWCHELRHHQESCHHRPPGLVKMSTPTRKESTADDGETGAYPPVSHLGDASAFPQRGPQPDISRCPCDSTRKHDHHRLQQEQRQQQHPRQRQHRWVNLVVAGSPCLPAMQHDGPLYVVNVMRLFPNCFVVPASHYFCFHTCYAAVLAVAATAASSASVALSLTCKATAAATSWQRSESKDSSSGNGGLRSSSSISNSKNSNYNSSRKSDSSSSSSSSISSRNSNSGCSQGAAVDSSSRSAPPGWLAAAVASHHRHRYAAARSSSSSMSSAEDLSKCDNGASTGRDRSRIFSSSGSGSSSSSSSDGESGRFGSFSCSSCGSAALPPGRILVPGRTYYLIPTSHSAAAAARTAAAAQAAAAESQICLLRSSTAPPSLLSFWNRLEHGPRSAPPGTTCAAAPSGLGGGLEGGLAMPLYVGETVVVPRCCSEPLPRLRYGLEMEEGEEELAQVAEDGADAGAEQPWAEDGCGLEGRASGDEHHVKAVEHEKSVRCEEALQAQRQRCKHLFVQVPPLQDTSFCSSPPSASSSVSSASTFSGLSPSFSPPSSARTAYTPSSAGSSAALGCRQPVWEAESLAGVAAVAKGAHGDGGAQGDGVSAAAETFPEERAAGVPPDEEVKGTVGSAEAATNVSTTEDTADCDDLLLPSHSMHPLYCCCKCCLASAMEQVELLCAGEVDWNTREYDEDSWQTVPGGKSDEADLTPSHVHHSSASFSVWNPQAPQNLYANRASSVEEEEEDTGGPLLDSARKMGGLEQPEGAEGEGDGAALWRALVQHLRAMEQERYCRLQQQLHQQQLMQRRRQRQRLREQKQHLAVSSPGGKDQSGPPETSNCAGQSARGGCSASCCGGNISKGNSGCGRVSSAASAAHCVDLKTVLTNFRHRVSLMDDYCLLLELMVTGWRDNGSKEGRIKGKSSSRSHGVDTAPVRSVRQMRKDSVLWKPQLPDVPEASDSGASDVDLSGPSEIVAGGYY